MPVYKSKNKTKDNRQYFFKTTYKDIYGATKQYKSKKFLTSKEAKEEERLFHLNKTNVISSDLTITDLFEDYVDFQKDKVKVSTYNDYKFRKNDLLSLHNIKIKDLDYKHFQHFKNEINKENVSVSYKNKKYKTLRTLLLYAEKFYSYNFSTLLNKMDGFTNKDEVKKEMLFFEEKEFDLFIKQEDNIVYKTFFEVLYYCGLRQGEAKALTWNDINFDKQTVSITKSIISKIKGQRYIVTSPKNKSSIRMLPLPKNVLNSLKILKMHYNKYESFHNQWFVFGGDIPLSDTTIQNKKNNNCKLANVKQIRIHDFRHSCASLLINKGASILLVSKYLGHSKIDITLNTYSHLYKNELTDIVKLIEKD